VGEGGYRRQYLEVRLHALAHGGVQPEGGLGPGVGRAEPFSAAPRAFQSVPVHLIPPRGGTPVRGRSEGG